MITKWLSALLLTALLFCGGVARAAVTVTNTALLANSNFSATTTTFTSVAIGTAAADRLVFVGVSVFDLTTAGRNAASMTVGGVSANRVTASAVAGGGAIQSVWFWLGVPSGTTATMVITLSASCACSATITAYNVTGADTTTPISASGTGSSGAMVSWSSPVVIPSGGVMLMLSSAGDAVAPAFGFFNSATTDDGSTPSVLASTVSAAVSGTTDSGSNNVPGTVSGSEAFWTNATLANLTGVAIQQAGAGGTVVPLRGRRGYGK